MMLKNLEKMTRYGSFRNLINNIHLNFISWMKSSIGEINADLFTGAPCDSGTAGTPHPLDAGMRCTDEIMSIQCRNFADDRLTVSEKRCREIFIRVLVRTPMPDDHAAVIIHDPGNFINILQSSYRENYRNFHFPVQRERGHLDHQKNEECEKECDCNHQDNPD